MYNAFSLASSIICPLYISGLRRELKLIGHIYGMAFHANAIYNARDLTGLRSECKQQEVIIRNLSKSFWPQFEEYRE